MASLVENLIDLLEQENSEYEKLLELSMKKTPVIIEPPWIAPDYSRIPEFHPQTARWLSQSSNPRLRCSSGNFRRVLKPRTPCRQKYL